MLNTALVQKETLKETIRLGYEVNKQKTIKKLFCEMGEFRDSKKIEHDTTPKLVSNIRCDKEFKQYYESYIVGTEEDELPDLVKVVMSYCETVGIDLETCIMNKHRYNKLRNKK